MERNIIYKYDFSTLIMKDDVDQKEIFQIISQNQNPNFFNGNFLLGCYFIK